jgi:hypothetical protein
MIASGNSSSACGSGSGAQADPRQGELLRCTGGCLYNHGAVVDLHFRPLPTALRPPYPIRCLHHCARLILDPLLSKAAVGKLGDGHCHHLPHPRRCWGGQLNQQHCPPAQPASNGCHPVVVVDQHAGIHCCHCLRPWQGTPKGCPGEGMGEIIVMTADDSGRGPTSQNLKWPTLNLLCTPLS